MGSADLRGGNDRASLTDPLLQDGAGCWCSGCVRRGGPDAEALASQVLLQQSGNFGAPAAGARARFDRYVGPDEDWRSPAAGKVSAGVAEPAASF